MLKLMERAEIWAMVFGPKGINFGMDHLIGPTKHDTFILVCMRSFHSPRNSNPIRNYKAPLGDYVLRSEEHQDLTSSLP